MRYTLYARYVMNNKYATVCNQQYGTTSKRSATIGLMFHLAPMSKEGLVAIRIFMPSELRDDFKTVCTLQKATMNKVVVELVENYVEQNRALLPEDKKIPGSLKELVRQNYFDLMNSGKLGHQRLKELSFGQAPTAKERQVIKQVLEVDSLPEE